MCSSYILHATVFLDVLCTILGKRVGHRRTRGSEIVLGLMHRVHYHKKEQIQTPVLLAVLWLRFHMEITYRA